MGKERGGRETERRRGREGGGERGEGEKEERERKRRGRERGEGEKEGEGGRHGVSVFDRVNILAIMTETIDYSKVVDSIELAEQT